MLLIYKKYELCKVFAVRSGGATGIVVKGPETDCISFCMDNKGDIRSIKFSSDNRILAVQRTENSVEFINFTSQNQPNINDILTFKGKNNIIGFVWIHLRELALISNAGVELITLNIEKKQIKSIKSMNLTISWFSWCSRSKLAILASNNGQLLWPVQLKQGTITKLPKLLCT